MSDEINRWVQVPHTCPVCNQGEIGGIMKTHDRGRWVSWDDYKSMRKKLLIDKAGWTGMSGEQSARIAELEAEVKKLKEDRKLLAQSLEALLPISLDEFSKKVLNGDKKEGKK